MKKYVVILMLGVFMAITASCGENTSEVETLPKEENEDTRLDEVENSIVLPDIEYEEYLTDENGNKLFGFNIPTGEIGEVRQYKNGVSVDIKLDEYNQDDITINVSKGEDEDFVTWYDEEEVSGLYAFPEQTASLERRIDTPYGEVKIFYCLTEGENVVNYVRGILKLNDEWGVMISCYELDENKEVGCTSLKNIITAMLNSENSSTVTYEYPHYLTNEKGEKVMGFNTPVGMTRYEQTMIVNGEEEVQEGVHFDDLDILCTTYGVAAMIECGEFYDFSFEWKNEIETIYGKANVYAGQLNGYTYCYEWAVFNVNGQNVLMQYSDYNTEGYTGELENIIANQLFVME